MIRILKILSRSILTFALVLLSLKPSLTNRIDPAFAQFHPHASSRVAAFKAKKESNTSKMSWRSSFQRNEDDRHLTAVSTLVLRSYLSLLNPSVDLAASMAANKNVLYSASPAILRI